MKNASEDKEVRVNSSIKDKIPTVDCPTGYKLHIQLTNENNFDCQL